MYDLKYLFRCNFNDGTSIEQTPEDISKIDLTKSAFFDVKQRLDEVKSFELLKLEDNTIFGVNLNTGIFYINDLPLFAGDPSAEIPHDAQLKLIYFRRVKLKYSGNEKSIDSVQYHIGYQCKDVNGKNYQQTIAVE